ncbi:MAG TPA: pilin, partial [Comamonas sp.]
EESGVITVTYNRENVGAAIPEDATILLTPSISVAGEFNGLAEAFADAALAAGNMDWACTSATTATATARGMPGDEGSLPAQFAPNECR